MGIKLIPRISHFVNKYDHVCCDVLLCLEKEKVIIAIKLLIKFWKIRVIKLFFAFSKCILNGFPEGEREKKCRYNYR